MAAHSYHSSPLLRIFDEIGVIGRSPASICAWLGETRDAIRSHGRKRKRHSLQDNRDEEAAARAVTKAREFEAKMALDAVHVVSRRARVSRAICHWSRYGTSETRSSTTGSDGSAGEVGVGAISRLNELTVGCCDLNRAWSLLYGPWRNVSEPSRTSTTTGPNRLGRSGLASHHTK